MPTGQQGSLRADARRNREKILAAARTLFGETDPGASMEDIARAAHVGVGTLYRRFPDWEALVCAVAEDNFRRVCAGARTAAAEEPSSWAALVRLLRSSQELRLSAQLVLRSQRAVEAIRNDPTVTALGEELLGVIDELVRGAQAEGRIRPDIGTGDVAMLYSLTIQQLPALTSATATMAADRCTALMIDALRAPQPTPLPGRPLARDDIAH